jgi:polyphosphate kinase
MLSLIEREREHAEAGRPARIAAKVNRLTDLDTIDALYRASQAGVRIDLIVRGACMLRPGVAGISQTVHVRSVVGRFLEHSRIFHFANGGEDDVYIGSADWMARNFDRRVEVVTPVLDSHLKSYLKDTVLPGLSARQCHRANSDCRTESTKSLRLAGRRTIQQPAFL